MPHTLTPQAALIHAMVIMSAADSEMSDRELATIGDLVQTLPVFRGFDAEQLVPTAEACARLLGEEGGLDRILDRVAGALPERLRETGYALAAEIAVADDGTVRPEEARLLELLRQSLDIGRLEAAAIEQSVWARYQTP